jgi:small redox-active disulfide protein 2
MKRLEILGTGCARCRKLQENTEAALRALGIECEVVKVTDIDRIIDYGILSTPALAVDGEIRVSGKVPSAEEIEGILQELD